MNAVLRGGCTGAIEVVDEQLGRAVNRTTADHQAVGGGTVAGQHAVKAQGAVNAGVVALDGQATLSVVATAQVYGAGVYQGCLAAILDADDAAAVTDQCAGRVNLQGTGPRGCGYRWLIGAQVTQDQAVVQGQPAALVQVDGLPIDIQGPLTDLGLLKRQGIRARTAVQQHC